MKKSRSQLNRILMYYTLTTLILMLALPTLVTGMIYIQRRDAVLMEMDRNVKEFASKINLSSNRINRFSQMLTSTNEWENELMRYFTSSYSEHHTYYLLNGARVPFLPNETMRQYYDLLSPDNIHITLNGHDDVYESTAKNPKGRKVDHFQKTPGVQLIVPLHSRLTLEAIGNIYYSYSIDKFISDLSYTDQSEFIIYNPKFNELINDKNKAIDTDIPISVQNLAQIKAEWDKKYFVKQESTITGHFIYQLIPKNTIWHQLVGLILIIFIFCGLTAGVIGSYIFRQLRKYSDQVEDILATTSKIEQGQVYYRINENNKEAELQQITKAINQMLNGQQEAMRKVFQLQLQHNEAVLKALQAQINPHFLYNTLEFIRMSAYVEGADSLAEFVYDFSTLLRNNITDEKEATIYQEVYFIKKYVGLYQARYPEKLTLNVSCDPALNKLLVPKFTLQPLIENYLVHGVDFSRANNELTIDIQQKNHSLVIMIDDNGKGMSDKELILINEKIADFIEHGWNEKETNHNLGIAIVAQRLAQKFGNNTKLWYEKNKVNGVRVWLICPLNEFTEF